MVEHIITVIGKEQNPGYHVGRPTALRPRFSASVF